jgi:hypothetical protein
MIPYLKRGSHSCRYTSPFPLPGGPESYKRCHYINGAYLGVDAIPQNGRSSKLLWEFGMSGSFYPLSIICQKKQADDDPDSDQVSINFGTYRILYQTESTERRNRLSGELDRSIVINKGEDIKRISQHLMRISDFRYMEDITR